MAGVPDFETYQSNPVIPHKVATDLSRSSAGESYYNVANLPGATFADRWAAAARLAHSGGGTIVVEPRPDYTTDVPLAPIAKPTVSVLGPGGSANTIVTFTGSGECLRHRMEPFTITQAGKVEGLTIDGTGAAPASFGLHGGDIVGAEYADLVIQNFTGAGSIGMHLQNDTGWTERNQFRGVHLNNNKIGAKLSMSANATANGLYSFGYNRWLDLRLNPNAGQIGFVTADGTFVYSNLMNLICNVTGSGVVMDVQDTSHISGLDGFLTAEGPFPVTGTGIRVQNGAHAWGPATARFNNLPHSNLNTLTSGGTFQASLRFASGDALPAGSTPAVLDGGVKPNFYSTHDAVMTPGYVDNMQNTYASWGTMVGAGLQSCFSTIYGASGNAWVFYSLPFQGSLGQGVELYRLPVEGAFICNAVAAPAVAMAAGAGTSPPGATATGNALRGRLFGGSGTGPAAGPYITAAYQTPYAAIPEVVISPCNAATAALNPFVYDKQAAYFQIGFASPPAASQVSGTYVFAYHVLG